MIIESKTMSNVFYSSDNDSKIDFSSKYMQIIEKNVRRTCMIAIVYDEMYGIGDGAYMDTIPDWLGLVRPKIDCGKGVDKVYELTDDGDKPNLFIDIFNIVDSITFSVDNESRPYQCTIEFDKDLLLIELDRYGIFIRPEEAFTDSMRVSYEFDNITDGCEISEPESY